MGRKTKGKNKKPHIKNQPDITKEAKHIRNPEGFQTQFIAWHFQCMDSSGDWPCDIVTLQNIRNRLHEYEKLKWSELNPRGSSNHPLPIDKIIPKAQKRLAELSHEDIETLYQLEIRNGNGRQRLWGIRVENIFQILWWDPKHEVCPSPLKHT